MGNSVYKQIELTGSSDNSVEEAVNNAINKAAKTVRQMRWFEIVETRGTIDGDKVGEWQVTLKIGFNLEE
jgi:hypothetical protein